MPHLSCSSYLTPSLSPPPHPAPRYRRPPGLSSALFSLFLPRMPCFCFSGYHFTSYFSGLLVFLLDCARSFHLALPSLAQSLAHSRCSINKGRSSHFIVCVFSSCIPLPGKPHIVHSESQTQHAQNTLMNHVTALLKLLFFSSLVGKGRDTHSWLIAFTSIRVTMVEIWVHIQALISIPN